MADTQVRINALYADVTVPINDLGKVHATLEESNFLLSELLLNTDPAALEQVQEPSPPRTASSTSCSPSTRPPT